MSATALNGLVMVKVRLSPRLAWVLSAAMVNSGWRSSSMMMTVLVAVRFSPLMLALAITENCKVTLSATSMSLSSVVMVMVFSGSFAGISVVVFTAT